MNRQDHILVRAMEECNELAQRISKALVFGMKEIQPGQTQTNEDRIYYEYFDLRATLGMAGIDAWRTDDKARAAEAAKVAKVEKYLRYSEEVGRLASAVPVEPKP